jgi:hypothetical protein
MQDRIKESLAKAEWCVEQADKATDPEVSRFYSTLARGWRDFAAGPLARPVWLGEISGDANPSYDA